MDKVLPINTILNGDCLELLKTLPDESVNAICTDPPYGLGTREPTGEDIEKYLRGESLDTGGDFMGKEWEIPPVAVWRECFRILKPGGHLGAFAGTRTWDIMSVGIRAAGFEKRDTIATLFGPLSILCWVQGQGFPKSHNVFKTDIVPMVQEALVEKGYAAPFKWKHDNEAMVPGEAPETVEVKLFDIAFQITKHRDNEWELPHDLVKWKGYGTALKPSFEPILVFRKPPEGTLAETVLGGGAGVIDIDGTRVKHASPEDKAAHKAMVDAIKARGGVWQNSWKNSSDLSGLSDVTDAGRWPPNVIIMHSSECKQVGTKKVEAPVINRFDEGMKPFGKGAGKKYQSMQMGDSEGKEEVPVWECIDGCPVKLLNGENSSKTEKVDAAKFFPQLQIPEAPFFYTGKATRREKNEGVLTTKTLPGFVQLKSDLTEEQLELAYKTCDLLRPERPDQGLPEGDIPEAIKEFFEPFTGDPANSHPTVKPVKLMEWLVGLLCPKDGVVVDPYCGSGTTCLAAMNKGTRFVGIEKDPEFFNIALKRLGPVKSAQEDNEFFEGQRNFLESLDTE